MKQKNPRSSEKKTAVATLLLGNDTKRRPGRAEGPCSQLKNMNFRRAGGLH